MGIVGQPEVTQSPLRSSSNGGGWRRFGAVAVVVVAALSLVAIAVVPSSTSSPPSSRRAPTLPQPPEGGAEGRSAAAVRAAAPNGDGSGGGGSGADHLGGGTADQQTSGSDTGGAADPLPGATVSYAPDHEAQIPSNVSIPLGHAYANLCRAAGPHLSRRVGAGAAGASISANGERSVVLPRGDWTFACNSSAERERWKVLVKTRPYALSAPMKGSFGLTNQLLAYAGLFSLFAMAASTMPADKSSASPPRWRLVPPAARAPFPRLIDVPRSTFVGRDWIVTDPCEAEAAVAVHKKRRLMHKRWNRMMHRALMRNYKLGVHSYKVYKDSLWAAAQSRRPIEVWNMYLRWPYRVLPMNHSGGSGVVGFFCGLHFGEEMRAAAELAIEGVRLLSDGSHTRYMAIHLRMETQDAATQGRPVLPHSAVVSFFVSSVFPAAEKAGVNVIVVCSGPLAKGLFDHIVHRGKSRKLRVVSKQELWAAVAGSISHPQRRDVTRIVAALDEKKMSYRWKKSFVAATNTKQAVVDLLLMEGAAVAVLTAYSSLTSLVVTRRCCASCNSGVARAAAGGDDSAVPLGALLYDIHPNARFSALKPFRCGVMLSPYVEGLDMATPSPGEDYYRPDSTPRSDIFKP